MKSSSLVLNAENIGCETAVFINSFESAGRVYNSDDLYLTLGAEGILSVIQDAMHLTTPVREGVNTSHLGAIKVSLRDKGVCINLEYDTMADPVVHAHIKKAFQGLNYYKPKVEGIYDVDVVHFYLAGTHVKTVAHDLTTKDFEHLLVDMYPGIMLTEMMESYSNSSESNMILTGEPGTGKTCFAKMMMAFYALFLKRDIDVIYVKDRELLKMDSFWANMSARKPDMMILDDLDDELRPRTEGRNEIVNNMLSFSDGIFEVDTKIIITTNLTDNAIDKALIRPGRCFEILSLPQLTGDQALSVWTDTFKAPVIEFHNRFGKSPHKISQAALMSEHSRHLKSDIPTYLVDPSISIRKVVEES